MFRFRLKYPLIFIIALIFVQCTKTVEVNDVVVAEVGLKKLYQSDIKQIIPANTEKQDSILMATDYIRKWVRQELLIQKANENLTPEQKDLTKEIEEYRNSLIIYKYKNELMNQQMDTVVTHQQVDEFYNANPDNFKLNNNIVKAVLIKVPIDVANIKLIKELVEDDSETGKNALREYCIQYAKSFDFFNDSWVNFEIVKRNIPGEIEDEKQFLSRNSKIEMKDLNYYYLVTIQEYKLQNELAPVEYVESNIKDLILNRRKIDFLKQVEENVYKEGVRQNKFKIYGEVKK